MVRFHCFMFLFIILGTCDDVKYVDDGGIFTLYNEYFCSAVIAYV